MRRLVVLSACLGVGCLLPTALHAASADHQAALETLRSRTDPCKAYSGTQKLRCESRHKQRQPRRRFANLKRSDAVYKRVLGHRLTRLQHKDQRERRAAQLNAARKTLRNYTPPTDHNSRRRTFLNDFRIARRDCMLEHSGRSRRLCLEEVEQNYRNQVREVQGQTWRNVTK